MRSCVAHGALARCCMVRAGVNGDMCRVEVEPSDGLGWSA